MASRCPAARPGASSRAWICDAAALLWPGNSCEARMTRTLFTPAPAQPGLRVAITTQPAQDLGAVLCRGRFSTPLGTVVALGAGGALWGLGFAGPLPVDQVEADLERRWPRARIVEAPEALDPAIRALSAGQGDITVR